MILSRQIRSNRVEEAYPLARLARSENRPQLFPIDEHSVCEETARRCSSFDSDDEETVESDLSCTEEEKNEGAGEPDVLRSPQEPASPYISVTMVLGLCGALGIAPQTEFIHIELPTALLEFEKYVREEMFCSRCSTPAPSNKEQVEDIKNAKKRRSTWRPRVFRARRHREAMDRPSCSDTRASNYRRIGRAVCQGFAESEQGFNE